MECYFPSLYLVPLYYIVHIGKAGFKLYPFLLFSSFQDNLLLSCHLLKVIN